MRKNLRRWRRKLWPLVALSGWGVAAVLAFVAITQSIELQDDHLYAEWGNVAEWVAGLGTVAVLFFALFELRQAREDRQDRDAEQARLISIEPSDPASLEGDRIRVTLRKEREAVVRNRSNSPIFDLRVTSASNAKVALTRDLASAKTQGRDRDAIGTTPPHWALLPPGQSTGELTIIGGQWPVSQTDEVTIYFLDARGRRWSRTGSDQPRKIARNERMRLQSS